VRIVVIGAGQVGTTIVEALHEEHDLTVVDLDLQRLTSLGDRFDASVIHGNGASRRVLEECGVREAELLIACTSRDEINIIAGLFTQKLAPTTKTIVRTTDEEYLEIWHERLLEFDQVVSSERETAIAISRTIGVPAARQTDVFAEGQVQIVEFDIEEDGDTSAFPSTLPLSEAATLAVEQRARKRGAVVGVPLREAAIPADSKVATIIRAGKIALPRGGESIRPGDRIVVIGSPRAAQEWSRLMSRGHGTVHDVVIYGAGRAGIATARVLIDQGIRVRIVEAYEHQARDAAELVPDARVFHATGMDAEFIERERIGEAQAAVFAMRDDAKNHYAATLTKMYGVPLTIAVVHDAYSVDVFERAGVDVAINPRLLTAEEIVRFAHDPRTRQVTMLEGDRYEILDITVRPESSLLGTPFRELPMTGALIGAIVREGRAIFPHGDDELRPGDRVIVFTESARVPTVVRAL
jgi:trk system potassium uptake protein TrkA